MTDLRREKKLAAGREVPRKMKNFATSILIVICLSQGKTQFIIIELLREVIRRKLLLLKHRLHAMAPASPIWQPVTKWWQ